jgi:hypothetical protein
MADPNLVDFYGRVARFEKARSRGYAFDAPGTLGRSDPRRRRSLLWPVLKPVLLVAACGIGLKATFLHTVGAQSYDVRVAGLMQGEGFDRLGGWLMQADPATVFAAANIGAALGVFR